MPDLTRAGRSPARGSQGVLDSRWERVLGGKPVVDRQHRNVQLASDLSTQPIVRVEIVPDSVFGRNS